MTGETCECCGGEWDRYEFALACMNCTDIHSRVKSRNSHRVRMAVASGELRPAKEFACVDCGSPADRYDHRHNCEPLNVDPVCRSCNFTRGPAVDWIRAIKAELLIGVIRKAIAMQKAEIVQLRAAGMSYATIGRNYRISKQRVQQIVARQQ